ncbi:MAG TPA: hypothetical protein VEU76_05475 [Candidatus Udaeobacter sp.]|nr:hypothetical protein [Candidatus Udaeobacter sp.]
MRRLILTVGMVLMGMGLVGGAAAALLPTSLLPLDQEVGTHTSAAGAVLGIGLAAAAVNPVANIAWVRAGILYGFVVVAFEAGAYFMIKGAQFHLGPVIFGLAFSLLLIATYPERSKLMPPARDPSTKKLQPEAVELKAVPSEAKEPEEVG